MITAEHVKAEYQQLLDAGATLEEVYEEVLREVAALRDMLTPKHPFVPPKQEILPEQEYKKVVYVKVKGKHSYEVHNYANTVEEDNATIINNVKKQLKEDKVDVVSVFVAEK